MIIREAQTTKEWKAICEYLHKHKLNSTNSIILFYAVNEQEEIIGVIGCEYVPVIEPLCANSGIIADKLYTQALETLKNKKGLVNLERVECYTTDSLMNKMKRLFNRKGFKFIEKTNRFVKVLNSEN